MTSPHFLLHTAIRWLDFSAIVMLLGTTVFYVLVSRPVLMRLRLHDAQQAVLGAAWRAYERRVVLGGLVLLLVISLLAFVDREAHLVHRGDLAVTAGEPVQFDGWLGHEDRLSSSLTITVMPGLR